MSRIQRYKSGSSKSVEPSDRTGQRAGSYSSQKSSSGYGIRCRRSTGSCRSCSNRCCIQTLGRRSSARKCSSGVNGRRSYTSRMNGSTGGSGSTEFCTAHGSSASSVLESSQTDGGSSVNRSSCGSDGSASADEGPEFFRILESDDCTVSLERECLAPDVGGSFLDEQQCLCLDVGYGLGE